MKTSVTKAQYLQLEGLLTLAKNHARAVAEIEEAAAAIVGAEDEVGGYYGHISDAMNEPDITAARLLKKMGITRAEATPPLDTPPQAHRWETCELCGPMVRCGYCGNNCCNGGSGENCPDSCASAYALQKLNNPAPPTNTENPSVNTPDTAPIEQDFDAQKFRNWLDVLIEAGIRGSRAVSTREQILDYVTSRIETIPGSVAKHAIVSDECRSNRGDMAAAHEAATRLVDEYRECYPAWKAKGAKFHFVLTIERPEKTP